MAKGYARRRAARERLRNGNNGNGRGMPRWLQLCLAGAGLAVVLVAGAGIAGLGVYQSYANDLRNPEDVIAEQPSGGAQIYDRNGKLLYEYVDDKSGLRSPVELEDISPWMIAATVSTEDFGYWDNPGVNFRGLARAGLEYFGLREADAADTTGGSSITQQLVKNIYIDVDERYERSVTRKAKETAYALELTRRYDKDQILEWYLNQISYGGLYNGVEAAAQGYFGKSAKDLNLAEAALLAGIPASPSRYDPINNTEAAIERRNSVLRLMQTRDKATTEIDGASREVVRLQVNDDGATVDVTDEAFYLSFLAPVDIKPQRFPVEAPHWVFSYIEPELERRFGTEALYRGGLRVVTTLDLALQEKAEAALETWISEFEASSGGHNGAVVAMDPRTSEILVMVGSRDYFRDDIQGRVNNALAENSPGSTLKPFAYAAAFEKLGWAPETLILDTPISFDDGVNGTFTPRNPSGNFQGVITVRNALGNSLNIPAVKTAAYVGIPDVAATYKKFGMTTLDEDVLGPSLVVGGAYVNLTDIAYGYSVFANNGVMRGVPTSLTDLGPGNRELDPVSILQITRADGTLLYPDNEEGRVKVQERQVIDPRVSYGITDILSDPNAHCITYGCGTLSIGRPWGVKTGTSEPFENSRAIGETWTFGYTPELVAGVWAGNADNTPMFNITSTSISYRTLRDFMIEALADVPKSDFVQPPGMKEIELCTPSSLLATPDCGRKVKTLAPDIKDRPKDDWWKKVKIDIRNGDLASEITPPQFIQERLTFTIPDSVQGFARSQAEEWRRYLGGSRAPTQVSTGQVPVRIDSPRSGQTYENGDVLNITGQADSPAFVSYRVEFGPGNPPIAWTEIMRSTTPQTGGGLALWKIEGLPEGTYTLRVVLEDAERGELSTFVVVTIDDDTPQRTPTPQPTPIDDIFDDDDDD